MKYRCLSISQMPSKVKLSALCKLYKNAAQLIGGFEMSQESRSKITHSQLSVDFVAMDQSVKIKYERYLLDRTHAWLHLDGFEMQVLSKTEEDNSMYYVQRFELSGNAHEAFGHFCGLCERLTVRSKYFCNHRIQGSRPAISICLIDLFGYPLSKLFQPR